MKDVHPDAKSLLREVRLHITRREVTHEFSYPDQCPMCIAYDMGVSDAEATN